MGEEELTGRDYWEKPMAENMRHPDYSPHAMRVVEAVMSMTTAQLESINLSGDSNGR